MNRVLTVSALALVALLILSSCAPAPTSRQSVDAGTSAQATRAPKVVKIGIQREPSTVNQVFAGSPAGGVESFRRIAQNYLVVTNDKLDNVPQLATQQISTEDGTWRINADGTMDTTWKLRPNIRWHDGTPFTSADLLFAFTVYKDPAIETREGTTLALMLSASTPDPQTFVVHWSAPFVRADEAVALEPLPRHLLQDLYASDKENLSNSTRFTGDFVGLGAYRITRWEPGLLAEFARFDDYYMGRPPLDTVIVRFLSDENALVANILAGDLDAVLPTGVGLEAAVEVKRRWEGTGNQMIGVNADRLRFAEPQHRSENARPADALPSTPVRQALYSAIDRQTLTDVAMLGLSTAADSWFSPANTMRPQMESAIPQYPYDPRRAQELLGQAGWTAGSDGSVAKGGQRLEIEILGTPGRGVDKEMNIIADGWKAAGVAASLVVLSAAQTADRERNATYSGIRLSGSYSNMMYSDRLRSSTVASAANRWSGVNQGGYHDPQVDALYDRLTTTIPLAERIPLHRDLAQRVFTDVALMPLYWEVEPVLAVQGMKNIKGRGPWNMFEWDKE